MSQFFHLSRNDPLLPSPANQAATRSSRTCLSPEVSAEETGGWRRGLRERRVLRPPRVFRGARVLRPRGRLRSTARFAGFPSAAAFFGGADGPSFFTEGWGAMDVDCGPLVAGMLYFNKHP